MWGEELKLELEKKWGRCGTAVACVMGRSINKIPCGTIPACCIAYITPSVLVGYIKIIQETPTSLTTLDINCTRKLFSLYHSAMRILSNCSYFIVCFAWLFQLCKLMSLNLHEIMNYKLQ
jgi:hypothetical protein